eukprot:336146-Rhodomonas_salina.1
MSGTDIPLSTSLLCYALAGRYAMSGTDILLSTSTVLRARYAMSSTYVSHPPYRAMQSLCDVWY